MLNQQSQWFSIDKIVEEFAKGRPVILVDDEKRENEGDLVIAASAITPQWVNFMITHCRGLLCLALSQEKCKQLGLSLMNAHCHPQHKKSALGTAFTVSIEAASGVSTGISAYDRAKTIQTAVADNAKPSDIVVPGHIFPLQAEAGGVLVRPGHTEGVCDLAQLAGFSPAGVLIEIMNDDGTMARRDDLEIFALKHNFMIGTISALVEFRKKNSMSTV